MSSFTHGKRLLIPGILFVTGSVRQFFFVKNMLMYKMYIHILGKVNKLNTKQSFMIINKIQHNSYCSFLFFASKSFKLTKNMQHLPKACTRELDLYSGMTIKCRMF